MFRYQVLKVMFLTEKKIMENKLGCASVKLLVLLEFAKTLLDFIIKKKTSWG